MSKRWTLEDIERRGLKTDLHKSRVNLHESEKIESVESQQGSVNANKRSVKLHDSNASTPLQNMQALGRLQSGEMNKTEKKYAARLETMKYAGDIVWWEFEPMNLRLADKCFYKVDFLIMTSTCALEVHEVKGYWTDDALVKIKVAANKFPFRFLAVQAKKGEWIEREF